MSTSSRDRRLSSQRVGDFGRLSPGDFSPISHYSLADKVGRIIVSVCYMHKVIDLLKTVYSLSNSTDFEILPIADSPQEYAIYFRMDVVAGLVWFLNSNIVPTKLTLAGAGISSGNIVDAISRIIEDRRNMSDAQIAKPVSGVHRAMEVRATIYFIEDFDWAIAFRTLMAMSAVQRCLVVEPHIIFVMCDFPYLIDKMGRIMPLELQYTFDVFHGIRRLCTACDCGQPKELPPALGDTKSIPSYFEDWQRDWHSKLEERL